MNFANAKGSSRCSKPKKVLKNLHQAKEHDSEFQKPATQDHTTRRRALELLSSYTSKEGTEDNCFLISCFKRVIERHELYKYLKKLVIFVTLCFERSIERQKIMISSFERSTERQKLYDLLLRKKFQSIIKST